MFIHEDERRILIEWSGGKVSKALVASGDCTVGDHYHRIKEERFLLLVGTADVMIGPNFFMDVASPREFEVPPGIYHRFDLKAGSILLGTASHEYDPADEVKGTP